MRTAATGFVGRKSCARPAIQAQGRRRKSTGPERNAPASAAMDDGAAHVMAIRQTKPPGERQCDRVVMALRRGFVLSSVLCVPSASAGPARAQRSGPGASSGSDSRSGRSPTRSGAAGRSRIWSKCAGEAGANGVGDDTTTVPAGTQFSNYPPLYYVMVGISLVARGSGGRPSLSPH